MRKCSALILTVCLVAATPSFAGNLTLENGQTSWQSTQCQKPVPPNSIMGAEADTAGEDMNSLVGQHNAYVDAAQNYMNCISNEADRDQTLVNQQITSGARAAITEMQSEVDRSAPAVHKR